MCVLLHGIAAVRVDCSLRLVMPGLAWGQVRQQRSEPLAIILKTDSASLGDPAQREGERTRWNERPGTIWGSPPHEREPAGAEKG